MSDHPMMMVKPMKYSQFRNTMNLHQKMVKVMVKALKYEILHESINLEHQQNDGKSNAISRNATDLGQGNHKSMNISAHL